MNLSDTQRTILAAAAARPDRMIAPPPSPPAPRAQIARKFLKLGLAEECAVPARGSFEWGANIAGLRITDEGMRAIGIDPDDSTAADDAAQHHRLEASEQTPAEAEEVAPQGEDALAPEAAQAAPSRAPRANLRDAAAAFLTAWDASPAQDATDNPISRAVEQLRTALAGKPARAARDPDAPRKPRSGTKHDAVIAMLRRPDGATVAQISEAMGWQPHTTRAFVSSLGKNGLAVTSSKIGTGKDSTTVWRIEGEAGSHE